MTKQLLLTVFGLLTIMGFTLLTHEKADSQLTQNELFYAPSGNVDWLKMHDNVHLSAREMAQQHRSALGLGLLDELVNYRTQTDELGMTHYRYQQYHQGVKVEGGELLMHERNGRIQTLNGKLVRGLAMEVQPQINADQAVQLALSHFPAERYMWQSEGAERLLKRIKNDPNATFYPSAELVLIDPNLKQRVEDFHLAFSLTIQAEQPQMNQLVFIDAISGELLLNVEQLHTQNDVPGTAVTRYSGEQEIITDSIAPGLFRLVETTRGGGIETYDLNGTTNFDEGVDFLDQDNYWDNVNAQQDEVATDAHWGAEMTFDFLEQVLNHSGVDGENMPLISQVHYDVNVVNAFWNGNWASFGDGNGENWDALTCLDVVAHEFAHGVTGNTARLIYRNESGALNESFSDILGAAVELWATPDSADWFIAEDSNLDNTGFRSMSNPNSKGDPDTYLSQSWFTGTGDNGGVHTNSGVQNYWFYLMTEGGSGNNSFGTPYSVEGLGLDTAIHIAFRNLKYYLTRFSGYPDAREGALQSAEDLYGVCSNAVVQTARAWYAVGVGAENFDNDVRLLSIVSPEPLTCGLTESESITVQFRYNGCGVQLQPGQGIPLAYQVDGHDIVRDTLTLAASLAGGDTLIYTFPTTTADLTTPEVHRLRIWSELDADQITFNDTLDMTVDNIVAQNVDLKLEVVRNPVNACFQGMEDLQVEIGFYGCDSIAAGESVEVAYQLNGGAVMTETITLPNTLTRGETFGASLINPIDVSENGVYSLNAWINYGPDFLNTNDSLLNISVANPIGLIDHDVLTFEMPVEVLDSLYLEVGEHAEAVINEDAARTGSLGMEMTGGNLPELFEAGMVVEPNEFNIWNANEIFSNKLCVCVNAGELEVPQFSFDLRQVYSPYYLVNFGDNISLASAFRVLLNDEQVGETFVPNTYRNDPWKTHVFSLADYVGGAVEICFQSKTAMNKMYDPTNYGDHVYLDNIRIGGNPVAVDSEPLSAVEMKVFPNPGSGQFTLEVNTLQSENTLLHITNHFGQIVKTVPLRLAGGTQNMPINLEELPAGVYRLQLNIDQDRLVETIVKL